MKTNNTKSHHETKTSIKNGFLEHFPTHYMEGITDYEKLFNYAMAMITEVFEIEEARKMFADIYDSMNINCPDKIDWFIQKILNNNFELKLDHTSFDKLLAAIKIVKEYGITVEYAISLYHDTHGHVVDCHYTPKNSSFRFESILDYDKMMTLVSEFKDIALIDTCAFGVPEHKEIPVKYDIENMTLSEICEAYFKIGGKPLIINP